MATIKELHLVYDHDDIMEGSLNNQLRGSSEESYAEKDYLVSLYELPPPYTPGKDYGGRLLRQETFQGRSYTDREGLVYAIVKWVVGREPDFENLNS